MRACSANGRKRTIYNRLVVEQLLYALYCRVAALQSAVNGEVSELAEGARLEIVYAPKGYPGFESPPLRHFWFSLGAANM